jgi:hypothetical protein
MNLVCDYTREKRILFSFPNMHSSHYMELTRLLVLIHLISGTVLPPPRSQKSVSFHESVKERTPRNASGEKIIARELHAILIETLNKLGLSNVSEDQFESLFIGLHQSVLRTDSLDELNLQELVEGTFFDPNNLNLGIHDVLDIIADNLSTIPAEMLPRFREAITSRFNELNLNDQQIIMRVYSQILSQLGFSI